MYFIPSLDHSRSQQIDNLPGAVTGSPDLLIRVGQLIGQSISTKHVQWKLTVHD